MPVRHPDRGRAFLQLEPGADPLPLVVEARFASGESRTLKAVTAASSDSSVAVIRDGAVVPLAAGFAGLSVDYGGVRTRVSVQVRRTVFGDIVALKPGESRTWSLGEGRYAITVQAMSHDDLSRLSMETDGLNCARDSRDGNTIQCVGGGDAEATLVRQTGTTAAGTGRARVRIIQIS